MENKDQPIYPFRKDEYSVSEKPGFGKNLTHVKSYENNPGLTKREYFAGLAMQGFLSNSNEEVQNCKEGNNSMPVPSEIARLSIEIADELLKQLSE